MPSKLTLLTLCLAVALVASVRALRSLVTALAWGDGADVFDAALGLVLWSARLVSGFPLRTVGLPPAEALEAIRRERAASNQLTSLVVPMFIPGTSDCISGATCEVTRYPASASLSPSGGVRRPAVTVIRPRNATTRAGVFHIHGGGWVLGSHEEAIAFAMALRLNCAVISTSYSLAPEARFPAAVHEVHAALAWAVESAEEWRVDPAQIILTGLSAGGNLALAAAHMARDKGFPRVRLVVPVIPATSITRTMSDALHHDNPHLPESLMSWFFAQYAEPDECARSSYCSPLLDARWDGLPPMAIIYGAQDVLAEDARLYARKLRAEGYAGTLEFPLRGSHYVPLTRWKEYLAAFIAAAKSVGVRLG